MITRRISPHSSSLGRRGCGAAAIALAITTLSTPAAATPPEAAVAADAGARDVRQSVPPAPGTSPFATGSYLAGPGGVVRAAGFTLTAAGLLAGVSALTAAEMRTGQLAAQSARLGPDSTLCAAPRVAACDRLKAGIAARDLAATAASVLFAGTGIAAAATLLSFFLLPPARPEGATLGGLVFTLSPHAGPQGGGVSLEASW